jgi:hypothetical protein
LHLGRYRVHWRKRVRAARRRSTNATSPNSRRFAGKAWLLFKLAEATVDQPEGIIKEVVYPVVGQKTLRELVAEFKAIGFDFDREVQERMRSSYGHHYRRILMPVLDALIFQSSNYIPGQRNRVVVPIEGDSELFYCRPSTLI